MLTRTGMLQCLSRVGFVSRETCCSHLLTPLKITIGLALFGEMSLENSGIFNAFKPLQHVNKGLS